MGSFCVRLTAGNPVLGAAPTHSRPAALGKTKRMIIAVILVEDQIEAL